MKIFSKLRTHFTEAQMPEVDPQTTVNLQLPLETVVTLYNLHYRELVKTNTGLQLLKECSEAIKRMAHLAQHKDVD